MKKIIILLFLSILSVEANAQDFKKDGNYVTAGYGLNFRGLPGTGVGIGLGPIMATYERGVTDILGIGRIGAGGGIAFSSYNHSINNNKYVNGPSLFVFIPTENKYKTNRVTPFIKATYHFEFDIPKLDVYAGVGIGVNIEFEKDKYYENGSLISESKNTNARPIHYIVAGARYYFSEAFGVYAEVGDGIANINAGVVFSF